MAGGTRAGPGRWTIGPGLGPGQLEEAFGVGFWPLGLAVLRPPLGAGTAHIVPFRAVTVG